MRPVAREEIINADQFHSALARKGVAPLSQAQREAMREAEQYARFDDILKGAIVGAPAMEDE